MDKVPRDLKPEQVHKVSKLGNRQIQFAWFDDKKLRVGNMTEIKGTRMIINLKKQICERKNPHERVEMWECENEHGVYDYDLEKFLLKARSK